MEKGAAVKKKHVFIFDVVGLSPEHLGSMDDLPALSHLARSGKWAPMEPVFPCLTLPCQASLLTGLDPCRHGVVANGFFYRDRLEVSFWDQYAGLVEGERLWESVKKDNPDLRAAVLFWQNTLYATADMIITPKPIHLEHEMIQWCYSKPVGFYEGLARGLGPFSLLHYWGPLASSQASEWIAKAAREVLREQRPELMLIYLPHMDYSSQRFGPDDPRVREDLRVADRLLGEFLEEIKIAGLEDRSVVIVLSEYSFSRVSEAIPLNVILRRAGFLSVREIAGKDYLDIEMSRAFAMVDHQMAHIYVKEGSEKRVRDVLEKVDGIQLVLDKEEQKKYRINHARSGELIAVSQPDKWFSYYWWEQADKAPSFAYTVDIHRKPGYDPLELFFDVQKKAIPMDTSLIKGSHGCPPEGGQRMASFLIGGKGLDKLDIGEEIKMTDVKGVVEGLLKG